MTQRERFAVPDTDERGMGFKRTRLGNHIMVWASCKFDGFSLNYLPILNEGGWWGKTWLLELLGAGPPL
jgi:hypothetical protein